MDAYEQAPTRPGLYWVKTGSYEWYNGIARIGGKEPYLCIKGIFFYADDKFIEAVPIHNISEWGPRIEDPDESGGEEMAYLATSIPVEQTVHGKGDEVFPFLRRLVERSNAQLLPIINAREQFGIAKHGQTLRTGDGRYTLQEIVNEKVDAMAYLAKWYMQTRSEEVLLLLYAEINQTERIVGVIGRLTGDGQ